MMNHATVKQVTERVKGCNHKLYTGISISSPDMPGQYDKTQNKLLWYSNTKPKDNVRQIWYQDTETGMK